MISILRLLSTLMILLLFAKDVSANHLHYLALPNDPIYTPGRIVDTVGFDEIPLNEWIIATGENDEDYYSRNGTTVNYFRPEGVPITATISVFDAPAFADHTNPRATAYYEFEVSVLASTQTDSFEWGLTDIVSYLKWDEAQNAIRADVEGGNIVFAPQLSDIGDLPLIVRMYYHFEDYTFTVVVIDEDLGAAPPVSWVSLFPDGDGPFENFHGHIGGTDPHDLDVYPFVSCQVDCTITALDWQVLDCDTVDGHVDVAGCGPSALDICEADLAQSQQDLAQANSDLAQASADLAQASTDLAQANADLLQASTDLAQANADLAACQAAPVPDGDTDGEPDVTDLCPATPAAEPVDSDGCSHEEFCTAIPATDRQDRRTCKRSDWQADEPTRGAPRDCALDRQETGDYLCVVRDD